MHIQHIYQILFKYKPTRISYHNIQCIYIYINLTNHSPLKKSASCDWRSACILWVGQSHYALRGLSVGETLFHPASRREFAWRGPESGDGKTEIYVGVVFSRKLELNWEESGKLAMTDEGSVIGIRRIQYSIRFWLSLHLLFLLLHFVYICFLPFLLASFPTYWESLKPFRFFQPV